jgi:hypothetical protein
MKSCRKHKTKKNDKEKRTKNNEVKLKWWKATEAQTNQDEQRTRSKDEH